MLVEFYILKKIEPPSFLPSIFQKLTPVPASKSMI